MAVIDKICEKKGIHPRVLVEEKETNLNWAELAKIAIEIATHLGERTYKKIGILYDPDVDGLYSGYLVENYLIRLGILQTDIFRFMNSGKVHGYSDEVEQFMNTNEIELMFVVDAGSSDTAKFNENHPNTRVVIIDHHPYDSENKIENDMISVLNVVDYEHLPELSGAGVTFRFLEEMNKHPELLGVSDSLNMKGYETFVGITVLSDICKMTVPENRYYVRKAYDNYKQNRFLQNFTFWGSHKSLYSFTLIPYLNALIRCEETEWAMTIVNNMSNPRVLGDTEADRIRIKAKQDGFVNKIIASGHLKEVDGALVHLRTEHKDLKSFNGLLANRLSGEYGVSTMVVCLDKENQKWGGSFRGKNFDNTELVNNWGMDCRGHLNACGVSVSQKDMVNFITNGHFPPAKPLIGDFTIKLSTAPDILLQELAVYNEMACADLEPVMLKITEDVSDIKVTDYEKRRLINVGNKEIVDFDKKPIGDSLLIEPSLARNGYQLLRK